MGDFIKTGISVDSEFWDKCIEVAKIIRNKTEVTISACEVNGNKCIRIQEYYTKSGDNEWHPSSKGYTIKYDEIDDLVKAIELAKKELVNE